MKFIYTGDVPSLYQIVKLCGYRYLLFFLPSNVTLIFSVPCYHCTM